MQRGTQIKLGLIIVGAIILAYSAYLRTLGVRELYPIIGILLIIIGVMGFFISGEEENDVTQEELESQS